jgi:WD40 repeat protein
MYQQSQSPNNPASAVEPVNGFPASASMEFTSNGDLLPPSPDQLQITKTSSEIGIGQPLPRIPGYELLEKLGPGGMGDVYKARQLMPPRLVALKMIKEGMLASPALRLRFRREAEAVARLQHPNIVPIYEFGEHEGRPFFTMEYLEGGTLQQKLGGVPQPVKDSARIVEILARAIHAAHLHQVIHRDLKPSNILLGNGALRECIPKVADFGLAKIVEEHGDLTSTQAVIGTIGYMPPEQASGDSGAIGPAADVYSLGAILYQMLTGSPPFHGDTTVRILLRIVRDEPSSPRSLNTAVPNDLNTICIACLEKDPAKRYASALELAEDLRRFQAQEPIKRKPPGPIGRLLRWRRRNPALAFGGAVAILSLVAIAVLSVVFGIEQAQFATEQAKLNGELEIRNREVEERRRLVELRSAENLLERGQTQAEQDEHTKALLALAAALETLPPEHADLEHVIRTNMGACLARQHRLIALFPLPKSTHGLEFSSDGKSLLTGCDDAMGRIWDIATGSTVEFPHRDAVWQTTISSDGLKVATASKDGTAAIWNLRTGKRLFELKHKPGKEVQSVRFSRDDKLLITGAQDQYLHLWDVATGAKLQELKPTGFHSTVEAFRFVRGKVGNLLACVYGSKVVIWRLPSEPDTRATEIAVFESPEANASVVGLDISSDCRKLLTVDEIKAGELEYVARVWDVVTKKPHGKPMRRKDRIRMPTFSPDGSLVLFGCNNGEMCLFTRDGEPQLPPLEGAERGVFHPSGRFIIGTTNGYILMWETATGRRLGSPISCYGSIEGIAFSPDNSVMALAGNGVVGLWLLNQNPYERLKLRHEKEIFSTAFHPSGRTFLTSAEDQVRVWDTTTGALRLTLPYPNLGGNSLFSADGNSIVSASDLNTVVWDITGDSPKIRFRLPSCKVALSPDGTLLAGIKHKRIHLWDLATGRDIRRWDDDTVSTLNDVVFVADDILATGTNEIGRVKLWNVHSMTLRAELIGDRAAVNCLAVSGNLLACGFGDGSVIVFDWTTGARVGQPLHLNRHPSGLAFVEGGKTLITSSNRIDLWDRATGRLKSPPLIQMNSVFCLTVSPDGQQILAAGGQKNRTARLWTLPTPVTVPTKHAVLWAQVVTGLEADQRGGVQRIAADDWRRRRDELRSVGVRTAE